LYSAIALAGYTPWVNVGSSYLLSDLLAAFLAAQLENFDEIQAQKR
jgi:dTDP-4-amino-4,6-dideoxygalactose transaminase